jgi:hypothetical protein
LVAQLLRYDAVTFLTLLEGVRLSQAGSSIWLLHEATHILYEQVRGLAIHGVCAVRHGVFKVLAMELRTPASPFVCPRVCPSIPPD